MQSISDSKFQEHVWNKKGDYKLANIFAKSYTVQNKTVVGNDIIVFCNPFPILN